MKQGMLEAARRDNPLPNCFSSGYNSDTLGGGWLLSLGCCGAGRGVVVNDLYDFGKGYLDDFAVGAFHLDAGPGESLRHLHAADDAAHAMAVLRDDLDVILPVKRFKGCEGFGDFHCLLPRFLFGRFKAGPLALAGQTAARAGKSHVRFI
jgi:hypothetical protein